MSGMFSASKFDSFVQDVLGGGMNKSASVGGNASSAYQQPAVNPQVEDMVKMAYANLSQEEIAMADTLGMMEAANTVKQASYIQDQISRGEQDMYGYNPYFQKSAMSIAELNAITTATHGTKDAPRGVTARESSIEARIEKNKLKKMDQARQAIIDSTVYPSSRVGHRQRVGVKVNNFLQDVVGVGGNSHVDKALEAMSLNPHAVGTAVYGVGAGAAALGAGGAHMALKRRAAAIQKAKLEQGLGRKILSHLSRHGGKYAIGAGLAGLGGIALANKSASEEEILWQHAAETGEAFLSKLASEAYDNALVEQLALFRQSALESIDPNAFY